MSHEECWRDFENIALNLKIVKEILKYPVKEVLKHCVKYHVKKS